MLNKNRYIFGRVPGLDEHGELLDPEFQGSGGCVLKAPYDDEVCIVKIPNMMCYNDDTSRVDAEVSVMLNEELLKQPIAELKAAHSWYTDSGSEKKAFVFKFYKGGDLMALLQQAPEKRDPRLNGPSFELDVIVLLVVQRLCLALATLHRIGWCHCDIKPENIFCPSADYFGLKACVLGDFGGLKRIGVDQVFPGQTGTKNWVPWRDGLKPAHGSFDMYSVGKIIAAFKAAYGPLSAEVWTLSKELTARAACDRPSASDLLERRLPELFEKLGQRSMQ
jgi:serine/threonine protein kinase